MSANVGKANGSGILELLSLSTKEIHQKIDVLDTVKDMVAGKLDRESLIRFLYVQNLWHIGAFRRLSKLIPNQTDYEALPRMRKSEEFGSYLEAQGYSLENERQHFQSMAAPETCFLALIYVADGSWNGHSFLQTILKRKYGLLDIPKFATVIEYWNETKKILQDQQFDCKEAESDVALHARREFQYVYRLLAH